MSKRGGTRLLGQTLAGRYILEEVIGDGGMGYVYRATHAWTGGTVAVKVLDTRIRGEAWVRRFRDEARITASLTHPNTVRVLDFGPHDDLYYLAMEYLHGIDLSSLLVRRGQPQDLVVHALIQVAGSLAEAHGKGLVHRDIKPSNIMLCQHAGLPDFAKVIDFGIARAVTGRGNDTDGVLGTMGYLSPEQISDRPLDGRADLYSLGCVAFELLTGRLPFPGIDHQSAPMTVLEAHLDVPPTPLRSLEPGVHPGLAALVMRMLNKNPEHRPHSAEALLEPLRRVLHEVAPERARPRGPAEPEPPPRVLATAATAPEGGRPGNTQSYASPVQALRMALATPAPSPRASAAPPAARAESTPPRPEAARTLGYGMTPADLDLPGHLEAARTLVHGLPLDALDLPPAEAAPPTADDAPPEREPAPPPPAPEPAAEPAAEPVLEADPTLPEMAAPDLGFTSAPTAPEPAPAPPAPEPAPPAPEPALPAAPAPAPASGGGAGLMVASVLAVAATLAAIYLMR